MRLRGKATNKKKRKEGEIERAEKRDGGGKNLVRRGKHRIFNVALTKAIKEALRSKLIKEREY